MGHWKGKRCLERRKQWNGVVDFECVYRALKVDVRSDRSEVERHGWAAVVLHWNLWIVLVTLHDVPHRHQLKRGLRTGARTNKVFKN